MVNLRVFNHTRIVLREKKVAFAFFFMCVFAGLVCIQSVSAQILNDSAQNIYGPEQTLITKVRNIRLSDYQYRPVDTALTEFHRFHLIKQLNNKYQDLGNHGTAMHPIFFQLPAMVGASFGFNAYDPYFKKMDEFTLYDVRSPFTHLNPVFAGAGRSTVDATYTRNVNEFWNLGMNFGTIRMDKQLAARGRGDRNVVSNFYDVFTHYSDSAQRYQAVLIFSRNFHDVAESGGIVSPELDPESEFFQYRDSRVMLTTAGSSELRQNFYIYQEYMLKPLLGVFTQWERQNRVVKFTDITAGQERRGFYPAFLIDPNSTTDRNKFSQNDLSAGIKGDKNNLFYSVYYRNRQLAYQPRYLSEQRVTEHYLGGDIRLQLDDRLRLDAGAEIMQLGNYRIYGRLKILDFEAEASTSLSAPSFLMQRYFGNHFFWENNFGNMAAEQLSASYTLRTSRFHARPKVSATRVGSYLYWAENMMPAQGTGSALILSPGLDFKVSLANKIYFDADIIYTQISGEDADLFRIPTLFGNGMLYYSNTLYDGRIGLHLGFDLHYKSAWYAQAYNPILQQFYLQNDFEVPAYMWADFVAVFKVNRTRIFAKVTHINQGLMPEEGYFITPFYTGLPRIFDIGLSWMFFD